MRILIPRSLGRVAAGEDPAAEAAEAKSAITVAELAERFLADEVAPKRSRGTFTLYSIYLKKHVLPDLGNMKAEAVTRAAIAKLHVKIGKSHPVTANRVKATLSGLFAFGVARGLLPASFINPAKGIEKFKETARERFLTAEEFERLGAALREAELSRSSRRRADRQGLSDARRRLDVEFNFPKSYLCGRFRIIFLASA